MLLSYLRKQKLQACKAALLMYIRSRTNSEPMVMMNQCSICGDSYYPTQRSFDRGLASRRICSLQCGIENGLEEEKYNKAKAREIIRIYSERILRSQN